MPDSMRQQAFNTSMNMVFLSAKKQLPFLASHTHMYGEHSEWAGIFIDGKVDFVIISRDSPDSYLDLDLDRVRDTLIMSFRKMLSSYLIITLRTRL